MDQARFEDLLARFVDDELSDDEISQLAAVVTEDPERRAHLAMHLQLSEGMSLLEDDSKSEERFRAVLETRIKAEAGRFEFLHQVLDQVDSQIVRTRYFGFMSVIAAGLLAVGSLYWYHMSEKTHQTVARVSKSHEKNPETDFQASTGQNPVAPNRRDLMFHSGVAYVQRIVGMGDDSQQSIRNGDLITPGTRLKIESGVLRLQFYLGAVVNLEGPAEIEVVDMNTAVLREGNVYAFVPPAAKGFTLTTPDVRVVDLGTEFGVKVRPGKPTEVGVFQGEVELYSPDSGVELQAPAELFTGQGRAISRQGHSVAILVDRKKFVDSDAIDALYAQQNQGWLRRWKQHSQDRREDPRVLLYYDFQPDDVNEMTLYDQSLHGIGADGRIVGCLWTDGRSAGKKALDFKRASDRIRFMLPGEYDALTLAAWIRVDGLDRDLNSLMLTDGWDEAELHWQIRATGNLGLAIHSACHLYSKPQINAQNIGTWVYVVATYDQTVQRVSQYFNGQLVQQEKLQSPAKVSFGATELGNWHDPISQPPTRIRAFNGRMDEFVIYRKALDDQEIKELYELGRPY